MELVHKALALSVEPFEEAANDRSATAILILTNLARLAGDYMQHQIRTTSQHECSSPKPDKRRNERFWNRVEMLSDIWFFVEVCDREYEIQRWIATTIEQAVRISEELELVSWSIIYVHIRAPASIMSGTVFEILTEAYQVGRKGVYIYKLANGHQFVTEPEGEQEVQKEPHQLRLLYARGR